MRPGPQPGTGNCPLRNLYKHDGFHVLHTKSYFSKLRYIYVNFSRNFFACVYAASYRIEQNQNTVLTETPNTEPYTSFKALVVK